MTIIPAWETALADIFQSNDCRPYLYDEQDNRVTRIVHGGVAALQDTSLGRCSSCARRRCPRCDQGGGDQVGHGSRSCSHIRGLITPQRRPVAPVAVRSGNTSNEEDKGKGRRMGKEKAIL